MKLILTVETIDVPDWGEITTVSVATKEDFDAGFTASINLPENLIYVEFEKYNVGELQGGIFEGSKDDVNNLIKNLKPNKSWVDDKIQHEINW